MKSSLRLNFAEGFCGKREVAMNHKPLKLKKKAVATLTAWALVLPSFIFLCVFTLYPIAQTLFGSLFSESLSQIHAAFAGVQNYINLFQDEVFLRAFWNNLIVALITVPVDIILATAMAVFTNTVKHGKWLVRLAFFYPVILPMIAAANIWLFIYTPQYGLVGMLNSSWNLLGTPSTVLPAIIVMLVWKQSGYFMIFYLSGLQNISKEVYEAAKMDGAGSFRIFRSITWPLLRPITLFSFIIALTDSYKMVDYLYLMTDGGPNNSSNMLLYYIYQTGFNFWDIGKASTITSILVVLLLLISTVSFFRQDKRIVYS
ncbi:MAG: sugar ABC transporter permease [Oscillospiraceae bacterium]|jgi:sn-glycerol 3-phosphate transport system permease protein|nr:sugar ABC transporter permease [Oscillospiraceae bacterium]